MPLLREAAEQIHGLHKHSVKGLQEYILLLTKENFNNY